MKKLLFCVLTVISLNSISSCSVDNKYSIPKDGLVGYYTFKETNANDESGNKNHGVISNVSFTSDRLGKGSEAAHFDSENEYIIASNPSFLNDNKGSIVAWVKFENLDHTQYVASVGDEGSSENYISFLRLDPILHTLGIYQRQPGGANWLEGVSVIETDKYYHLVMLSDGLQWTVYINGVKENLTVRQGSNSGKLISQLNSIDNFVIGGSVIQAPYTKPNFSGVIDEVLLYNRPLTEQEITALYANTKP